MAAGADKIHGDLLKAGLDSHTEHIHQLKEKCWTSRLMPQDFKDAKITTGDRGDCNNYRGIPLLSVTGEVLARLTLKRVKEKILR